MCRCLKVITEKFRRYMKEKNVLQRIKKRSGQMWNQEKNIEKAQPERNQGRTYDENGKTRKQEHLDETVKKMIDR